MRALLAPIRPRASWVMSRFSLAAIRSASGLARARFGDARTRAMFAGVAAHGMVPLDKLGTGGFGLGLLVTAHAVGWPVARGGSQQLGAAMAAYLRSLGGEIQTGARIGSLDDLPDARAVLLDVTPRQLLLIAGERVPARDRHRLARYRYGPGVFKMDWALNAPVPWRARECAGAGTVHIGGSAEEIAFSEHEVWRGRLVDKPYAIVVQASRFDATRAPSGQHTLWAYCHVPNGSGADMRERIERQIERFAPGFRDCIIGASALGPPELEQRNANLVGGDIAGGAADLWQLFARPTLRLDPYETGVAGVYLCSSSTPPGVGVHGMCGYHAARSALRALS